MKNVLAFIMAALIVSAGKTSGQNAPIIDVKPDRHNGGYPHYVFEHGDVVTWDASGSRDPDGGDLIYRFSFNKVQLQKGPSPTFTMQMSNTGDSDVTQQLFIQVIDSENKTANYFSSVRTLPGEDPTQPPTTETDGRFYFLTDHLGTIRATVSENAEVVQYADYFPFGSPMARRVSISGERVQDGLFGGLTWNEVTGLYRSTFRWLDPAIGRWSALDPLARNSPWLSPYHYARGNPVSYLDSNGLDWFRHDSSGAVIWSPETSASIVVDGQTFANIGTTFFQRVHGGTLIYGNSPSNPIFVEDDENLITATRQASGNGTGTISTFEFESLSGFFLEPDGPSSSEEGSGLRIPPGGYELVEHNGPRFSNHFALSRVPGRSAILIHAGNRVNQTAGCLMPGFQVLGGNVLSQSAAARDSIFARIRSSDSRSFIYIRESEPACE